MASHGNLPSKNEARRGGKPRTGRPEGEARVARGGQAVRVKGVAAWGPDAVRTEARVSGSVSRPSYSARPTTQPNVPAAASRRTCSKSDTPPDAITGSRVAARIWRRGAKVGPASSP